MASYQINHYIDTPFGQLHIYSDPAQTARAAKLIKETPQILFNSYKDAAERYGKDIIKKARECILTETPPKGGDPWPELSKDYVAWAGEGGIYYKEAQYFDSIGIHKDNMYYAGGGGLAKTRYFVGLPHGVTKWPVRGHKRQHQLTLQEVALILELGASTGKGIIPPRPLWKPLFGATGGKDKIRRLVTNAVKRQLSKYMI